MDGFLTLVSGPSRGGKSRWAEHLAARSGRQVVYLATGPTLPDDPDWQHRLALHRNRRPSSWQCREVGRHLAEALLTLGPDQLGLVDSLGTWVAAGLDWDPDSWEEACAGLLEAIRHCAAPLVLVCEEVGWGVVPATAIGGLFRDRQGHLQQQLMALCTAAWLVLHGRAVDLLALSQPVPELLEP
ncbi:bifunctional adenosylcobinamide kinase/adenosylcobinamide-phosphate guanylyltransferase [Synechococcus sp. CCY9202]|uniref:bifunctional adenosylcobinamide kinase/adenosylcobinamide-phosphate guanylyltransferase n=1 Tax=Synechococcus sp. CCY9202 TaxID=174698 RepID=UPI002B22076A|nr:bifunctional adenosylcobinamide kinase/adenosylcobinamide-phosphate guanylyltransferase [Synechococcus sp. CCY9202]MEA5424391.1 bifunctional adenosylcobinamide kinase/adenosylcobinamide-phosphate guanylyltransferase [Synechococcus sp. CCY9202]